MPASATQPLSSGAALSRALDPGFAVTRTQREGGQPKKPLCDSAIVSLSACMTRTVESIPRV